MRKITLMLLVTIMVLPLLLNAEVNYLSEEDYKSLDKKERLSYWERLENEMVDLQQRKADAIANKEKYQKDIDELDKQLAETGTDYDNEYNEIIEILGVSKSDIPGVRRKLDEYNRKIDNWNNLSDSEIWNYKKAITELIEEYETYKNTNVAKIPDFRGTFSDLDNKIRGLKTNLQNARPKYYFDNYTVETGDFLSKISGYSFIYNDPEKWGIIYRANRDQIKDPNVLNVGMVLNIPRGLPYSWKVYRGESLWRIASYPEVYGSGAQWPKIYRENKDQIKDPNLIYPNQVFRIPRD